MHGMHGQTILAVRWYILTDALSISLLLGVFPPVPNTPYIDISV